MLSKGNWEGSVIPGQKNNTSMGTREIKDVGRCICAQRNQKDKSQGLQMKRMRF